MRNKTKDPGVVVKLSVELGDGQELVGSVKHEDIDKVTNAITSAAAKWKEYNAALDELETLGLAPDLDAGKGGETEPPSGTGKKPQTRPKKAKAQKSGGGVVKEPSTPSPEPRKAGGGGCTHCGSKRRHKKDCPNGPAKSAGGEEESKEERTTWKCVECAYKLESAGKPVGGCPECGNKTMIQDH